MRAALALVGVLLLTACRSGPGPRPLEELVPPGTAYFALEPIPTPAESDLEPWLAPFGRTAVVGERAGEPAAAALALLIPDRVPVAEADAVVSLSDLAGEPESFTLSVSVEGGGVRVRIAGADPAGRHWAVQALRQLVFSADGRRFVRLGRIRDRPGFPLRGSKRPRRWEALYRANFSYQGDEELSLRDAGRVHRVATLSPGGTLDATEAGVAAAERFFREEHGRGARRFCLQFDDVTYRLTPESRERFGTYPRAVVHYLKECREVLRRIDPGAILYWLPQTYWTRNPLLDRFARDLGVEGGLPVDLGLVLTGPEVISDEIAAADIERVRRAFGLTRTKALIYDNPGREGDHGPLRGRGADLLASADAVFGERGEVLNRITRLDYSWNPRAYDPERSLLLACREIVGPAAAQPLARLIKEGRDLAPLARLALYREAWRRLDPEVKAPVPAEEVLAAVWRAIAEDVEVDTPSR